jgi:hypothetical protein
MAANCKSLSVTLKTACAEKGKTLIYILIQLECKDIHVLTPGKEKQREPGLLPSRSALITAPETK